MTKILNVVRNDDWEFQIVDQFGKLVEGPFDTSSAAWRALELIDRSKTKISSKKSGGQKAPKDKAAGKSKRPVANLTQKQERRMKRDAGKAPDWVRSVAAAKFDPAGERAYRTKKLGTFGAASEVKRIDPAEYLKEKAAKGEA